MSDEMSLGESTGMFRFEVRALKEEVTSLKEELQQVAQEMRGVAAALIEIRTLDVQGKVRQLESDWQSRWARQDERIEAINRGQFKVMTVLVALNSLLMLLLSVLGLYAAFNK